MDFIQGVLHQSDRRPSPPILGSNANSSNAHHGYALTPIPLTHWNRRQSTNDLLRLTDETEVFHTYPVDVGFTVTGFTEKTLVEDRPKRLNVLAQGKGAVLKLKGHVIHR
jgi:hypothetical protein